MKRDNLNDYYLSFGLLGLKAKGLQRKDLGLGIKGKGLGKAKGGLGLGLGVIQVLVTLVDLQ